MSFLKITLNDKQLEFESHKDFMKVFKQIIKLRKQNGSYDGVDLSKNFSMKIKEED